MPPPLVHWCLRLIVTMPFIALLPLLVSQWSTASCLQTPPLPLASCLPAGCCVTPVVALPPPLVLLACCLCLSSSQHAACLATSCLRLATCRRLLSAGTSPLICLSFDDWFSHIILLRRCIKCPSSTPAFIHTGWLLRLISLHCFCLPSSHQHRHLLMCWLLTSHPVCILFAPAGCLCVQPGMPDKSVHGYMSGICPNISIYNWGRGCISDMSRCRKMQNRVDLGLKRLILMSKTHMFLCSYAFKNAPLRVQEFCYFKILIQ